MRYEATDDGFPEGAKVKYGMKSTSRRSTEAVGTIVTRIYGKGTRMYRVLTPQNTWKEIEEEDLTLL